MPRLCSNPSAITQLITDTLDIIDVINIQRSWTDDHELCFTADVYLTDKSTEQVEFKWVSADLYADVKYYNRSIDARTSVHDYLFEQFRDALDDWCRLTESDEGFVEQDIESPRLLRLLKIIK